MRREQSTAVLHCDLRGNTVLVLGTSEWFICNFGLAFAIDKHCVNTCDQRMYTITANNSYNYTLYICDIYTLNVSFKCCNNYCNCKINAVHKKHGDLLP